MADPTKPVDRETLYEEVWSEPVSVVAPRYGLSDVGLAKICRKLAIPLPSRGYWAKVKAGRIMSRAPLPKLKGSPPIAVGPTTLSAESVASQKEAREAAVQAREKAAQVVAAAQVGRPQSLSHHLVLAAQKKLSQKTGWGASSVRSAPKEVLNVSVTEGTLDRALLLTDALITAVEKLGFVVKIDSANSKTLMHSKELSVDIEFVLKEGVKRSVHVVTPAEEMTRQRYALKLRTNSYAKPPDIPYNDYAPTGILTLEVGTYPSRTWKDTPRTPLENRIEELATGVVLVAQRKFEHEQEIKRRQVEEQRAHERYELLSKRREGELGRLKTVETQAANWERATKLRAFAHAFETNELAKGELTAEQLDWLAWVRAKADGLDPFAPISDPILSAPELNRYRYR
jgi:hypothetical protein